MKSKRSSLNILIAKCIGRHIMKKKSAFLIFLISLFIVGFLANFYYIRKDIDMEVGKLTFGSYQCSFYDVTEDVIEKIKKEDGIVFAIPYFTEQNWYNRFFYGNEEFLKNTNYSLEEGRMPETEDEILCESAYLYQKGIEFDEDNLCKISLDGKEYTVTGILGYATNGEILSSYVSLFFLNDKFYEGETYDVVMKSEYDNYKGYFDKLAKKYGIPTEAISYNNELISYTGIDENGNHIGFHDNLLRISYFVICFIMILVVYEVIRLQSDEVKNTGFTLLAQGISRSRLTFVYMFTWVCFMIASIGVSLLLTILINYIYVDYIGISVSVDIYKSVPYMFVAAFTFAMIIIVFITISFFTGFRGRVSAAIKNKGNVRIKKKYSNRSLLTDSRYPFWVTAKANITMKKGKHILLMGIVCISLVLITLYSYIINDVFMIQKDINYDYRLSVVYTDITKALYGTGELREKYADMQNYKDKFKVFPVFYTNGGVEFKAKDASEEYLDYLRNLSPEYNGVLTNINTAVLSEGVIFIGVDDEILRDMYGYKGNGSLKKDECILVENTKSNNDTGFRVGFEKGDELHSEYFNLKEEVTKEINLKIVDTVEDIIDLDVEMNYEPVIFISMELFNDMENIGYPSLMYINKVDITDKELYEYFKGTSDIKLTDLDEEKEYIGRTKLTYNLTVYIIYVILAVLLAINCFISMYEKFHNEKQQIAILEAMGVGKLKNFLVTAYGMIKLIMEATVIGTVLSVCVNYVLYLYIRHYNGYYIYSFPVETFVLPLSIIVVIFAVVCLVVYKMIDKIQIARVLSS